MTTDSEVPCVFCVTSSRSTLSFPLLTHCIIMEHATKAREKRLTERLGIYQTISCSSQSGREVVALKYLPTHLFT